MKNPMSSFILAGTLNMQTCAGERASDWRHIFRGLPVSSERAQSNVPCLCACVCLHVCLHVCLCVGGYGVRACVCGVVWCGVVWCGVVWCGVVWCGVVWCGVVWCGVVWCGVVWCGVVWCGVRACVHASQPTS